MNTDIYEVSRDEYVGFIGQLDKTKMDVEQFFENHTTFIKIKSKTTGILLCTRIIPEDEEEHYFVFNMPLDDERIAAKPVRKITLETQEEVQSFINALSKIQRERGEAND